LARLHGVQLSYRDVDGRVLRPSLETLLGILPALGVPVSRASDAPKVLEEHREHTARRLCEPVVVAWNGRLSQLGGATGEATLELEDGSIRELDRDEQELVARERLPHGYHTLRVANGRDAATALVVSAPRRAPSAQGGQWGVFLPLYAARSERNWGVGDLTDLQELCTWTATLGGHVVATLPIFATFLDVPFEPSPNSPVIRLHYNELHIDPERIPEARSAPQARELLASPAFRRELKALRATALVDHRAAAGAKRRFLEPCAQSFFGSPDLDRASSFRAFLRAVPDAEDYAAFRAMCEHRAGVPWQRWPEAERDGHLAAEAHASAEARYHLYVQWLASEQLEAIAGGSGTAGLYLDLPLGVHPAGYDAWRHRDAFANGAAGGAPPDAFFSAGQNWGFAPLHPARIREQGYRYPIACIRRLMRHAAFLRIDHVMGLHRLYWIPDGMDATAGAYVRYQAEEWYAILTLEAHRAGTTVVGEDLGTVSSRVRHAMQRHELHRTYVLQFELNPDPRQAVNPPPEKAVASPNTHDMAPFAAFWTAEDARLRHDLGFLDAEELSRELTEREELRAALRAFLERQGCFPPPEPGKVRGDPDPSEVLHGCLRYLAASEAKVLVIPLEDLWGETHAHNMPGTGPAQHPNWCAKARYSLEHLHTVAGALDRLEEINRIRIAGAER
jgi:4-alpha-glucanotransferase